MMDSMLIAEVENDKYVVRIGYDDMAESPRVTQDNLGMLLEWSKNYDFGDAKLSREYDSGYEAFKAYVAEEHLAYESEESFEDIIYLPVYMYSHSGITLNTTGFSSMWDSGQVGYIYTTKEKAADWTKEFSADEITVDEIKDRLRQEIKELDCWVTGELYRWTIYEKVVECECCGKTRLEFVEGMGGYRGADDREYILADIEEYTSKELRDMMDKEL